MARGGIVKAEKVCPGCGQLKEREQFRYGGQIRRWCAECYPAAASRYRDEHREQYEEYNRRYREQPGKRERDAARVREDNIRLRRIVLEHYGGGIPSCACCGESTYEFLALDHIEGGGQKHRKEFTGGLGGIRTYRWAISNGFPPIFRVLCHNCNSSIGFYGYCPHQRDANPL